MEILWKSAALSGGDGAGGYSLCNLPSFALRVPVHSMPCAHRCKRNSPVPCPGVRGLVEYVGVPEPAHFSSGNVYVPVSRAPVHEQPLDYLCLRHGSRIVRRPVVGHPLLPRTPLDRQCRADVALVNVLPPAGMPHFVRDVPWRCVRPDDYAAPRVKRPRLRRHDFPDKVQLNAAGVRRVIAQCVAPSFRGFFPRAALCLLRFPLVGFEDEVSRRLKPLEHVGHDK